MLLRFAQELEARTADLVDLNVLEVGSIRAWAEFLQIGLPMQHFRDMVERVLPQYPFEKPMAPTFGGGTFGSSLARGSSAASRTASRRWCPPTTPPPC